MLYIPLAGNTGLEFFSYYARISPESLDRSWWLHLKMLQYSNSVLILGNCESMDYDKLKIALVTPKDDLGLFRAIVNAPFDQKPKAAFMFLGIIVLLLVNKEKGTIDRIVMSDNEMTEDINKVSVIPFKKIKIPLNDKDNIIARALATGIPQNTTDWRFIYSPVLNPDEAHINQASSGISYSAVYPLEVRDGGALIFSYYLFSGHVGNKQLEFMKKYTKLVANVLNEPTK